MPLRIYLWLMAILILGFVLAIAAGRAVGSGRMAEIFACETGTTPSRNVALYDAGTRLLHRVSRNANDNYGPAWNADGTRLTYREALSRRLDIVHALDLGAFAMSVQAGTDTRDDAVKRALFEAGSGPHAFTLGYGQMWQSDSTESLSPIGYGFRPSLSPDRNWVLYYADTPDDLNAEIYAFNPVTRQTVNLSQHAAHDWNPVWSPDGDEVAFVSTRDGNAEIYVVPFACVDGVRCASQARRLTQSGGSDVDPTWSSDGQRLAFVHEQRRVSQLMMVDLATGDITQLSWPGDDCRSPAWRP